MCAFCLFTFFAHHLVRRYLLYRLGSRCIFVMYLCACDYVCLWIHCSSSAKQTDWLSQSVGRSVGRPNGCKCASSIFTSACEYQRNWRMREIEVQLYLARICSRALYTTACHCMRTSDGMLGCVCVWSYSQSRIYSIYLHVDRKNIKWFCSGVSTIYNIYYYRFLCTILHSTLICSLSACESEISWCITHCENKVKFSVSVSLDSSIDTVDGKASHQQVQRIERT